MCQTPTALSLSFSVIGLKYAKTLTERHRGKDSSTETKAEDERQTEKGWKNQEETKRYQWRDSGHSSRLIGELVRLMDRKEDLFGRGQLIRLRSH